VFKKLKTGNPGASQEYLNKMNSEDFSISVKVGSETYTAANTDIDGNTVAATGSTPVEVVVTYNTDGDVADGDFIVTFNTVTLSYSTVE